MFVVSGVTGHTGAVVASTLLQEGRSVRVIVRDAAQGEAWRARGADVAVARLEDATALTAALRGATGVYALIPPNYTADNPLAAQAPIIASWAQAVAAALPARVVLLSSIGAEQPSGTGPIVTVHRAEAALRQTGVPLTALRASYFMENWGGVAQAAKSDGVLPSMLAPGRAVSMVATADIGRTAAALLVEDAPPEIVELAGPRDYTPEDVAAAFARKLGRAVKVLPVAEEQMEPALVQAGLRPALAALFREMNVNFNRGAIAWRGEPRRGRVAIDELVATLVA